MHELSIVFLINVLIISSIEQRKPEVGLVLLHHLMGINTESIYNLLASGNHIGLSSIIEEALKGNSQPEKDWDEIISVLQKGCREIYQKHWLKTHHIVLSIFGLPELRGVDCSIFKELHAIKQPEDMVQASDNFFSILIGTTKKQLQSGGSTLFFNVDEISSTRSAIIVSDLVQARFREAVFVLEEIDKLLPNLTKEWVNVSRLWRTGYGYRILKSRSLSTIIHIKEYARIRKLLLNELDIDSNRIGAVGNKLREKSNSTYLNLSKTLDDFVAGLIASHGIRGTFEPHYRDWIDHEGLDDF
jgi:hypothetical protein